MKLPIIAIDGPTGAGKSTIAKLLAQKLGYLCLDTGAMYRAITLKALREKINLEDEKALVKLSKRTKILFEREQNKTKILLDGEDISEEIRQPDISKNTLYIACSPGVRKHLVKLQQVLGENGGVVIEGRDIGTAVFPQAEIKFYLDANVSERAERRYQELQKKGIKITKEEIEKEIKKLDYSDKTRKINPLKVAKDAMVINSTNLNIDEVIALMLKKVLAYLKQKR